MPPLDPSAQDLPNLKISGPDAQPRPATRCQKLRRIAAYSFTGVQIQNSFHKNNTTARSSGLRSTKPKKNRDQKSFHAPPRATETPAFIVSVSRATSPNHALTRAILWHVRKLYDVIRPGLTVWRHSTWFDPPIQIRPKSLTRIRTN